mgnify:CR=1 FL=1
MLYGIRRPLQTIAHGVFEFFVPARFDYRKISAVSAFVLARQIDGEECELLIFGDERALPVLIETIDRDDINFLEFQELKYAIEKLGGEYTRPRCGIPA